MGARNVRQNSTWKQPFFSLVFQLILAHFGVSNNLFFFFFFLSWTKVCICSSICLAWRAAYSSEGLYVAGLASNILNFDDIVYVPSILHYPAETTLVHVYRRWSWRVLVILNFQPPWDLETAKKFIIHYTYGCDYNLKVKYLLPSHFLILWEAHSQLQLCISSYLLFFSILQACFFFSWAWTLFLLIFSLFYLLLALIIVMFGYP